MPDRPDSARMPVQSARDSDPREADPFPNWFTAFLHDRQTRKPSSHTMKAYRQDFDAIARLVTNGNPARMDVADITRVRCGRRSPPTPKVT
jgi:integrase/recombinase XerC